MGGKALQGLTDIRPLSSYAKHEEVKNAALRILTSPTQSIYYQKVRKFGSIYTPTPILSSPKLGHSDVDFIIREDFLIANKDIGIDKLIAEILGSKAFVRNGDVLSCEFQGHQIDIISSPPNLVQLNSCLNGHGGTGRFIVDLMRPYGLNIDRNGAHVRVEHEGEFVANVKRSEDFYTILTLSGVDAYQYSGSYMYAFKQLEDAYQFIYNSYLFTLGAFGLNSDLEYVGDGRRLEYPPYAGFIKYIQKNLQSKMKPVYPTDAQKKYVNLRMYGTSYNGGKAFDLNVKTAVQGFIQDKALRKRFNGDMIKAITGLKDGPYLGKFMEAYRLLFSSKDKFMYHIMSSSLDTIEADVKAFYESWSAKNPLPAYSEPVEPKKEEVVEFKVETQPETESNVKPGIPPLTVSRKTVPELVKVR